MWHEDVKERGLVSHPLLTEALIHYVDSAPTVLSNPALPKAPSLNTITLRVGASTYEFGGEGDTVQSIAAPETYSSVTVTSKQYKK